MKSIRTYSEMSLLETFDERFEYLKLGGEVGKDTFGFDRWMNQILYHDDIWRRTRQEVIVRDNGCDLGDPDHPILTRILIHHMNPITKEDLVNHNPDVYNPEYLITTCHDTHNAIHYGDEKYLRRFQLIERKPNDTTPWK